MSIATLIVKIDYFTQPDARETGRILDRLGLAYSYVLKSEDAPPQRLVLLNVEISSWIASLGAFLESAAAATKLIEQREHLSELVRNLVVGIESIRQSNAGQIPAAIRNVLVELATPLNRKRAAEVHIHVHGDNANIFVLNGEEAAAVARAFPKTGGGGGAGGPLYRTAPRPQVTQSKGDYIDPLSHKLIPQHFRVDGSIEATLNFRDGSWLAQTRDRYAKPIPVMNDLGELDTKRSWRAVGRELYGRSAMPQFVVDALIT